MSELIHLPPLPPEHPLHQAANSHQKNLPFPCLKGPESEPDPMPWHDRTEGKLALGAGCLVLAAGLFPWLMRACDLWLTYENWVWNLWR